jgi:hypothetical protein
MAYFSCKINKYLMIRPALLAWVPPREGTSLVTILSPGHMTNIRAHTSSYDKSFLSYDMPIPTHMLSGHDVSHSDRCAHAVLG